MRPWRFLYGGLLVAGLAGLAGLVLPDAAAAQGQRVQRIDLQPLATRAWGRQAGGTASRDSAGSPTPARQEASNRNRDAGRDELSHDLLAVMGGVYDTGTFGGDNQAAPAFWAEYRFGLGLPLRLMPMVGGMVTTKGTLYGYAGLLTDIPFRAVFGDGWFSNWYFTPSAAVGLWSRGNADKDLDNTVEFRTGGEITYRFENGMRLGGHFYHISNASLGDNNPGAEMAGMTFVVPARSLFGD